MISDADILKTYNCWRFYDQSRERVAKELGLSIGAVQRRLEAHKKRKPRSVFTKIEAGMREAIAFAQVHANPTGAPQSDALPRRHIFIPDTQIRPGVPTDHIEWIAKAVVHYRPDVIVVAGDWWDFPSLNSHSKPGSAPLENQRYQSDLDAGNAAFAKFCKPIDKAQEKDPTWKPRKVFLCGNHEDRADRAAEADPKFLGHVGSNNCQVHDFEWHPFLKIVWIDGIAYAHYFQNSHSKFAIGGSIDNRLNKIGASFVQGHEQGKREGARIMASGRTLYGLVAGSAYLHQEEYRGRQGQRHWRGIYVLNEVQGGEYDGMPLSLNYLCRKNTGKSLVTYMRETYSDADWEHLI